MFVLVSAQFLHKLSSFDEHKESALVLRYVLCFDLFRSVLCSIEWMREILNLISRNSSSIGPKFLLECHHWLFYFQIRQNILIFASIHSFLLRTKLEHIRKVMLRFHPPTAKTGHPPKKKCQPAHDRYTLYLYPRYLANMFGISKELIK